MRIYLFFAFGAFSLVVFTQCTKVFYPNTQLPAPMLHTEGEQVGSVSFGSSSVNSYMLNGYYARALKPGRTAMIGLNSGGGRYSNFFSLSGRQIESFGRQHFIHAAYGMYKFNPRTSRFHGGIEGPMMEAYAGLGHGFVNRQYSSTFYTFDALGNSIADIEEGAGKLRYVQPYFQFNLGYLHPDSEYGLAFRTSYVDYYKGQFEGSPDLVYEDYAKFYDQSNYFTNELTLFLKLKMNNFGIGAHATAIRVPNNLGFPLYFGFDFIYRWNTKR